MKVYKFFESLRKSYLKTLPSNERNVESKKLKRMDKLVTSLLHNSKEMSFISNNRLFAYTLFLAEKKQLKEKIKEKIVKSVYFKMKKLDNTLQFLNYIGKKLDIKFLLIKSLNIIPYLPVYDIDLFIIDSEFPITSIMDLLKEKFEKSNEKEINKLNFLPKEPNIYYKLSFHLDITWDGVKIFKITESSSYMNYIKILPYVYINSPRLEATIRMQECLLEKLYFNLIDYLFISNYLEKYSPLLVKVPKIQNLKKLPIFVDISSLIKYNKLSLNLLFKNILRWFSWRTYFFITKKVPFHE
jgi:hypothetical protein